MVSAQLTDGWTPGQHALIRAVTGLHLASAALWVAPKNPWFLAAAVLALAFVTGKRERWIAAGLSIVLAVIGLQPADPFILSLGLVLLLRSLRLPLEFCWLLLAACLAWSGVLHWQAGNDKLASAEALFILLILMRSARPWIWLALLVAQIALTMVGRGMLFDAAPLFLLFWAFDPAWLRPRSIALPLTVFYDGDCGFCHRSVQFLLHEDRSGLALRFAPLQGQTFARLVPEAQRAGLPDSIVVRAPDGALHVRSAGALLVGGALGGLWRPLAALARLIPAPLRDAVYDGIARVRGRLFRKPESACPLLPAALQKRFDLD